MPGVNAEMRRLDVIIQIMKLHTDHTLTAGLNGACIDTQTSVQQHKKENSLVVVAAGSASSVNHRL